MALDAMNWVRWQNRWLSSHFPRWRAERVAKLFLSPYRLPLKAWEQQAESSGIREEPASGLSVLRWTPRDAARMSPRPVLLVHGWGSRATQMYGFVPLLLDYGLEVIALDAPAHGHSAGHETDPWNYAQALLQVANRYGPLGGVVAHSMGAAAAALAMANGMQSSGLVTLAAPASIRSLIHNFARVTQLPEHCLEWFTHAVEQRVGKGVDELNVARALAECDTAMMFIHDNADREISSENLGLLARHAPAAETWLTHGLGHRKLIRSVEVHLKVADFLSRNDMRGEMLSRGDEMLAAPKLGAA